MTTFGYDFTDTDEGMGDFVTLTPGRYVFKFTKAEKETSGAGNPMAKVFLEVVGGNPNYIGGTITQYWVTSGAGAFRWQAFLKALGIKLKERGKVNLGKYLGETIGARVSLKEGKDKNDAGETMWFHELAGIVPGDQMSDLLASVDDEDEDEVEDDDEGEDEGSEDIMVEDLAEMGLAELKELCEEFEVSIKPDKGKSRITAAALRKRLAEVLEAEEDEEEDDEDEDDGEEELTVEDIEEMSLAELKELAEEYEVSIKPARGKKKITSSVLRNRIIDELFEEEDEDDADDADDEEEPF